MKSIFTIILVFIGTASMGSKLDSLSEYGNSKTKNLVSPKEAKKGKFMVSSASSIVGANLFYNLNGKDIENLVGAANVRLNTVDYFNKKFRLNIIGNISKVSGDLNKDKVTADLIKLVQSSQGLSVGIEPVYIFNLTGSTAKALGLTPRIYGSLNYKANVFKDIVDSKGDTSNINLDQGRFVFGVEIEGIKFEDDQLLYLGAEIGVSVFDKEKYLAVFGKNKSSLWGTEITAGIPLFAKLKLLLKHTWANGTKSVFSTGIILSGVNK